MNMGCFRILEPIKLVVKGKRVTLILNFDFDLRE